MGARAVSRLDINVVVVKKTMLSPVAATAISQEDECSWPVGENPPR